MKLSEQWLREWVDPALSTEDIAKKLTLCGVEVESLTPVAEKFSNVVIAELVSIEKHPEADRLHVCQVNIGQPELLTIVCGATNLKLPMKVPAALVGAVLPNNIKITRSKLRGVVSNGMLCSGRELTLTEESNGILELPYDAPIGQDVWDYLNLSDRILDLAISPNRGDCLSMQGMSREIAAITASSIKSHTVPASASTITDKLSVTIQQDAVEACPSYAGRIIKDIKPNATTPIWLQERLRRSGIRSIHPIVDVMNYVMMELGQPMHAFDLQKITGNIQVRFAKPAEKLILLDNQEITLDQAALIIADDKQACALAGVMGGFDSAVTTHTQSVFLESAIFKPHCIARTRQKYNLASESSHRFERGIDPTLQTIALERATALILEIAGGKAGPIIEVSSQKDWPCTTLTLRTARVHHILGFKIDDSIIETLLQRLHFQCKKTTTGWQVTVPIYRTDITQEIDLIEEIIRLYGYENVPLQQAIASLDLHIQPETLIDTSLFRRALCDLGYHEVITYSFISQKFQQLFDPTSQPKVLTNPMTADMSVMRTNLWPGLVAALLYNQNRQQLRVRLFETGLRFIPNGASLLQQKVLSGLVSGAALPEQWGEPAREVDFFDLKGDLSHLLDLTLSSEEFEFKPGTHAALHPGQTAEIWRNGRFVGIFGALHPSLVQELDVVGKVFLFELVLDELIPASLPVAAEPSKFPEIRRDIAIFVDRTVPAQLIQDTIIEVGGELLKEINVFDVYQGKGVPPDHKSIALALTLQHSSRTLLDEEVADIMNNVVSALKQRFAAELRG